VCIVDPMIDALVMPSSAPENERFQDRDSGRFREVPGAVPLNWSDSSGACASAPLLGVRPTPGLHLTK